MMRTWPMFLKTALQQSINSSLHTFICNQTHAKTMSLLIFFFWGGWGGGRRVFEVSQKSGRTVVDVWSIMKPFPSSLGNPRLNCSVKQLSHVK